MALRNNYARNKGVEMKRNSDIDNICESGRPEIVIYFFLTSSAFRQTELSVIDREILRQKCIFIFLRKRKEKTCLYEFKSTPYTYIRQAAMDGF